MFRDFPHLTRAHAPASWTTPPRSLRGASPGESCERTRTPLDGARARRKPAVNATPTRNAEAPGAVAVHRHGGAARMTVAAAGAAPASAVSGLSAQLTQHGVPDEGVHPRHAASTARGHAVPHPVTVGSTTRQRGRTVTTDTTPPRTATPCSRRCSPQRAARRRDRPRHRAEQPAQLTRHPVSSRARPG